MDAYAAQWSGYKNLRAQFFLIWLVYVPLMAFFSEVTGRRFHTYVPTYFLAVIWLVWLNRVAVQIEKFKCPRCGRQFADDLMSFRWRGGCLHKGAGAVACPSTRRHERVPHASL